MVLKRLVASFVVILAENSCGRESLTSSPAFLELPAAIKLTPTLSDCRSLSLRQYSRYGNLRTGSFVGGDAWYCCLDHPDSGLRSKLTLSCPLERGRVKLRDGSLASEDTEKLLDHAFGLLRQEPTAAPTMVTYKPTATAEEVWEVASMLMENQRVRKRFPFFFPPGVVAPLQFAGRVRGGSLRSPIGLLFCE